MPVIVEPAPAKINLTLEVLGRRPDGHHELLSLVAFAAAGGGAGDDVTLDSEGPVGVRVSGPFAPDIDGPNLVATALDLVRRRAPDLRLGAVHLEKRLPVAAGIGGGSADAAAALRAIRRANPGAGDAVDWPALALELGADVPVCLGNRPAWMSGRGERVEPLDAPLPHLDAVLVNTQGRVPHGKTAFVFRTLAASAVAGGYGSEPPRPRAFETRAELLAFMRARGNALTDAARSVMPAIDTGLAALGAQPGLLLAALSGAGPTCFGIFDNARAAAVAEAALAVAHPGWWIETTRISGRG